jgi:hypothetical protein
MIVLVTMKEMLNSIKTPHPTNNEKTVAHYLPGFNCKYRRCYR